MVKKHGQELQSGAVSCEYCDQVVKKLRDHRIFDFFYQYKQFYLEHRLPLSQNHLPNHPVSTIQTLN